MPEVNVQQALHLPPAPAVAALREILVAMANERAPWNEPALRVELHDVGMPDLGYIAVPIAVETGAPRAETPTTVPLTIRAKRNAHVFPVFEGSAGATGTGPAASTLWLGGSYTVPLQGFGALLDATLIANVAQTALRNFLTDLADAVQKRAEGKEYQAARYRLMDAGS